MSDLTFELGAVPNRYQDVVQRMAVLYELRRVAETTAEVGPLTEDLIRQWRARIGAITNGGWSPRLAARGANAVNFARNCRPTFVISRPATRPCNHRLICPFCYARWVREIWQQIDGNFPAPDPEAEEEHAFNGREMRALLLDDETLTDENRTHSSTFRFHLVARKHTFYRDVLPSPNPHGMTVPEHLTDLLADIRVRRAEIIKMVDPVGAFLYTTIEPWNGGTQWKMCHRQLFKMLPTKEFPSEIAIHTNGYVTRYARPTRKVIMKAVAKACQYPAGLMTGDAERTVELLAARQQSNFRGYGKFRSFRNQRHT